jgi:hypothetical protein
MMIRSQDPQAVVDGGRDLRGKATTLDSLIGSQVAAVRNLEQHWKGDAAVAARARAYRNIQHQHRLHELIEATATAMLKGGQVLVVLRQVLLNWVASLSQIFNVADDGVVTPRPPMAGDAWAKTAATFTACTQSMIRAFMTQDEQLANRLKSITAGNDPGNDPTRTPGFGPGIDPDGFNNGQIKFQQTMAGAGVPDSAGHDVPRTDLSIMGMTPDGRLFTVQGDTADSMGHYGGPGDPRRSDEEGGRNNIIYWKMDDHGKWVVDEVVKNPFPAAKYPDGVDGDISTIPTSTFNVEGTMYTSVMNVKNWDNNTWETRSSTLFKSTNNGQTWQPAGPTFPNAGPQHNQPFQVQSFAPKDDGYVYMYGTQDGRNNDGMHVARVPASALEDASQYQYWNGSSFSADQNPITSPPVLAVPASVAGVGEPSVHFYENKALVTFNDANGGVYTSSSTDGVNWTEPQRVSNQIGSYGAFQSPFSGDDSADITLSLWNPYGTNLYKIENSDTTGLGAY